MSASGSFSTLSRTWPGLKRMGAATMSFLAVGFVVSFFTGAPFLAGFLGGLDQFVAWTLLVAGVAFFGYYSDEIGVGFAFTFIGVLALVSKVLPGWLTEPFAFITVLLFGTPSLGIDPVTLAVLLTATVLLYWAVKIRLFGRGKNPGAVANRMRTNAKSLVRQYGKLVGAIFGFGATAVFLFSNEALASPLGELFGLAANAPMVGAYISITAGYVAAFFTSLPLISSFGQTEFLLLMVVIGLVALGAEYSSALD